MARTVEVNRAPVLTLWATVVAERLGHEPGEALTLGRAVAGLNAQSKGQRLGIFEPSKEKPEEARKRPPQPELSVPLLGRQVPATHTPEGVRATDKGKPIHPESVSRYLEGKFGEQLPAVREAMEKLAASYSPEELAGKAFDLYERFRPAVPAGERGWGAKGKLDLDRLEALASK